jgi:hypothetical protein
MQIIARLSWPVAALLCGGFLTASEAQTTKPTARDSLGATASVRLHCSVHVTSETAHVTCSPYRGVPRPVLVTQPVRRQDAPAFRARARLVTVLF